MLFDVKKLEDYIRVKYNIKEDVEVEMFMNFKIQYGIYFKCDEDSNYSYLDIEEYKSYLRDEKLKQLGI